jgi:DnaJ homolog subfamily C member 11
MSSQATRSNDANRETPNGGTDGPSGGDSRFETGREFAASREDYNFDDDENNASEDNSGDEHTRASAQEELRRLMRYSDAPDYYSLLGVPRTPPPTDSQIRSAFQRLSLSFHPDKQPLHLRHVARDQYSKIQRAYDTLLDPQKRVVYDLIGEEGVNAEWGAGGAMSKGGEAQDSQIGVRTMTSAEFRQWFLRLMQRRERSTLEDMIGSRVCSIQPYCPI